ncbi:MAG: VWA domain-containing protein [Clostridia bacterium]|nr:VWA domain-containing protein [Clostridia bacterium]
MDKIDIYNEYISKYEAPAYVKPVAFDETASLISKVPHKELTFNKVQPDAVAFATRSKNMGTSGSYNIYVNPDYTKSKDELKLHEYGHIVFSHLLSNTLNEKIFKLKVGFAWSKLEKFIEVDDSLKLSKKEIQEVYTKKVANIMLNYAMDYEVNSKLFTKEEFDNFKKRNENDFFSTFLKNEEITPEYMEKLLEEKDKGKELIKPLWPEDVNFPLKLQFTQYLDLMLKNPEDFFQKLKIMNSQMADGGEGEGQESQGSGGDSDDKQQEGKGKGSSGKISTKDLDKMEKAAEDMNGEKMEKAADEAEKADKGSGGGDEEDELGMNDENDKGNSGGDEDSSQNYSPIGHGSRSYMIDASNSSDLEKAITKAVFNKVVLNERQDPVYYYNRKKYNSNILISKSRPEQLWRPGNVVLLVDCSGSINDKAISAMVNAVRKVAHHCGQKSRLVWWDTELEGDTLLRKSAGPEGSGGTNIAKGIKYVREHYLRQSNDKLIIISDYEDNLGYWLDEASKIKNDIMGLCWLYAEDKAQTPESYVESISYGSVDVRNFLKKIDTTLVNIG